MTIINENTVVVFSSEELKEALEKDNGYTYIYLGNHITLTNGIQISKTKSSIVIDGTYDDTTYQFTDKKSSSTSDTISLSSTTKNVKVCNMNIIGYNYYGIIYVPENQDYKNTIVEYNNIDYTGPQISFHPYGLTRFIDCSIIIQDNYLSGNEVAECNQIEIGGTTVITHKSTANSSFWFRNPNPSLKILKDAKVTFTSESRELFYGVNNLNFSILENASFDVTTHNGMTYGTYGTGITTIDKNASFSLKQTSLNGSRPAWYSYGTITLNLNSSLSIINDYENITSSNYNIYFSGSNAGFYLNNPAEVILYNSKANVIYATTSIPFSFEFNRINLFDKAISFDEALSVSNLPTYSWYKSDLSKIEGVFTSSGTTISSHNYTKEELDLLPSLNNFIFQNKKIVSIGDVLLCINALTDQDTQMTGISTPYASILIQYNDVSDVVIADDTGKFIYSYSSPLPIDTVITFTSKKDHEFLYRTKIVQIVYSGELTLDSASSAITFLLSPIQTDPILCPRKGEFIVTVTDSRVASSKWKLYASINHDLMSDSGIILKNSLVVRNQDGVIQVLSDTPTLVYEGEENGGNIKVTNVSWKEEEGILLQLEDPLINFLEYKAIITWSITE